MTEQQENGTILTTEQLALLEAIQNRLIPAQDGMPGAGDAGCPMTIDRFLSERPALRRPVIAALNAVEAAAAGAASEATATAGATHVAFLSLTDAARDEVLRGVETGPPGAIQNAAKSNLHSLLYESGCAAHPWLEPTATGGIRYPAAI